MSFFALKISDSEAIDTVNSIKSGSQDFVIQQLNQLESDLTVGSFVFMQLGGWVVSWDKGLIGLAEIIQGPFDKGYDPESKKNFRIRLKMDLVLNHVIKREDFRFYADAYDAGGIGPTTKGEQNQAIKSITDKQAQAILRVMAENQPDMVEQIKGLFSSDFSDGIFGKMTCLVEKNFTYEEVLHYAETEELQATDEMSDVDTADRIRLIEKYSEADLETRKKAFRFWFSQQLKPLDVQYGGKPYGVVEDYTTSLELDAAKLLDYDGEKNLYAYSDLIEFFEAMKKVKAASNYDEVNKKRINKGFSCAMDMYCTFLLNLHKNSGLNPLDSYEYTPTEVVQKKKTCLDVKLPKRTRTTHKLNTIVYGAPGTGKTYSSAERALAIVKNKSVKEIKQMFPDREKLMEEYKSYVEAGQIVFTTFHQNYGYEEFIQGLRPDTKSAGISFRTVDGIFKSVADEALFHADRDYVIIIDEINRANISKVFGELITLIEDDKRWGEINQLSVTLQSGDPFAVPNNLYILGTMNSADKSISLIDAALRRRFSFIEQTPEYDLIKDTMLKNVLKSINKILAAKLESTDLLVGHSYFMNCKIDDLAEVMNNNIIPLLYEYFYDQRKRVKNLLDEVISETKAPIVVEKDDDEDAIGRIRVVKKAEVVANGSESV